MRERSVTDNMVNDGTFVSMNCGCLNAKIDGEEAEQLLWHDVNAWKREEGGRRDWGKCWSGRKRGLLKCGVGRCSG